MMTLWVFSKQKLKKYTIAQKSLMNCTKKLH